MLTFTFTNPDFSFIYKHHTTFFMVEKKRCTRCWGYVDVNELEYIDKDYCICKMCRDAMPFRPEG